MAKRYKNVIKRERKNMTDEKRVARALEKCAIVFEEERLNMSEGLAVAEQMLVNTFANAATNAASLEEQQGVINVAEEYLTSLVINITKEITEA